MRVSGFVDLNVQAIEARPCDARCSPRYAMLTRSARRLSSDPRGTYAQNQALSHDRAKKVEDELCARGGVHTSLVDALGQEMPLSSNVSDSGRERNRRVEVWLR